MARYNQRPEEIEEDPLKDIPGPEIIKSRGRRNTEDWQAAYMEHAEPTEAPRVFCVLAGLWAVAAVCKRNVWLDLGAGVEWPPNLYCQIVGPPGVARKSSTLGMAAKLVKAVGVMLGPSQATYEGLHKYLKSHTEISEMPGYPSYVTTPCSFALDESSTLLDYSNVMLSTNLTQWFDSPMGEQFRYTIARNKEGIHGPCLNIFGCTTPAHMQQHVNAFAKGSGLQSRMITVFASKRYQLIPIPELHPAYARSRELFPILAEDLDYIQDNIRGPFKLSPCGQQFMIKWYTEDATREDAASERGEADLNGSTTRNQVKIAKIALILAISQGETRFVYGKHLQQALDILDTLQESTEYATTTLSENEDVKYLQMILAHLSYHPNGKSRELITRFFACKMPVREMERSLEKMLTTGMIQHTKYRGETVYVLAPDMEATAKKYRYIA